MKYYPAAVIVDTSASSAEEIAGGSALVLLTIAIPTYNRNQVLAANLAVLLDQLTPQCRLLIIDNCSDVPVADTLGGMLAGYPSAQVAIVRNRVNVGVNANILRCFELCDTEWLWILGDDDCAMPEAITTMIDHIVSHPMATFISFSSVIHRYSSVVKRNGVHEFVAGIEDFGHILGIWTSLYRVRPIQANLRYGYQYAYSMAPHIVALLMALRDGGETVVSPSQTTRPSRVPSFAQPPYEWYPYLLTLQELPLPQVTRRLLCKVVVTEVLRWLKPYLRALCDMGVEGSDVAMATLLHDLFRLRARNGGIGMVDRMRLLACVPLIRFPRITLFAAGVLKGSNLVSRVDPFARL